MNLQLTIDLDEHTESYRSENNLSHEIKLTSEDRERLMRELEESLARSKFFADLFDEALERILMD